MSIFAWQALGMGLLFGTLVAGHRLWRSRRSHDPSSTEALAVWVLLATFAGGFWGAFAWWPNYPDAFSWPLPPLAAKMLAAAGWSFALASARALMTPFAAHLRMVLAMLWVYLAPLTLAILTQHLARFDFSRPVTWAFFTIVVALLVAGTVALWQLRRARPQGPAPSPLSRLILRGIAAVSGLWALALFFWPNGPSEVIWPWRGDPLTTRLIASMFLSVAVAALMGLSDHHLSRTALWTTLAYGAGVVIAGFAQWMAAQPGERGYAGGAVPLSYLLVWGGLGVAAAVALTRKAK